MRVGSQQTGIKEAIDLNTRMMGEAVSELIKNNQLLALQSQQLSDLIALKRAA